MVVVSIEGRCGNTAALFLFTRAREEAAGRTRISVRTREDPSLWPDASLGQPKKGRKFHRAYEARGVHHEAGSGQGALL